VAFVSVIVNDNGSDAMLGP